MYSCSTEASDVSLGQTSAQRQQASKQRHAKGPQPLTKEHKPGNQGAKQKQGTVFCLFQLS